MKQYELAERNLVLGRYAEKFQLPQRMGKTLRVTRHKRMALPNTPLQEGVPPDAVALSIEYVDVVVEQWGIVALLTDVAQITLTHPALQKAIDRTGLAMAEMLEREIAETLMGGTTVLYGGNASSRVTIDAGDVINTALVNKATVGLRARGASPQEGQLFSGVMSPQHQGDLNLDTTFVGASNFANVRALQYGEVGIWQGVRWAVSNFLPIFAGVAAPTTAAATATKTQVVATDTGGNLTSGNYQFKVVARDINSDYERRISLQSANISSGTGDDDLFTVTFPSSANYVYDLYVTAAGGTTAYLVASRQAASSVLVVDEDPDTAAAVAPENPADAVSVFIGFIFGKDAFGRVELDGMSMQSYITPAGASYSNPLAQGRKVGSKIMWKCFILDNAYFVRFETGSGHSAELPA
jgi:N4-gp56 family major capsid protein